MAIRQTQQDTKSARRLAATDVREEVHHEALKAWPAQVSDAYWRFMVSTAQVVGAERIIEIGCGYARHVTSDDVRYRGVDYGYFVEYANQLRPGREWVKIDFDRYDESLFATLQDPDGVFFTRGRLEHVRDPELLLDCLSTLGEHNLLVIALESEAGQDDEPRPFFRRRVSTAALVEAFSSRGLDTRVLGVVSDPEARATGNLALVGVGASNLLDECDEPLRSRVALVSESEGVDEEVGAEAGGQEGEPVAPETMLFTPDLPLLSSRVAGTRAVEPRAELDAAAVMATITEAREERRPFSLMRLGNGEARVLGFPDFVPPVWLARSVRNWFRDRTAELRIRSLQDEASALIAEADLIGVVRGNYRDAQYQLPLSLLEVYGLLGPQAALCAADVHLHLLKGDFYTDLLRGEHGISVISGHKLDRQIASAFGVRDVRLFKVPAQAKFFFDESEDLHFPTVFERLRANIDVRWPGEIFLVGAGFLGKIYCGWVKQRGGIALDIGSVFDLWAGESTRGRDPSVARRHRLP
jgi:hypothetical protein